MSLHRRSIEKMLDDQRVWDRVEKFSMPEPNSGCVFWLGNTDKDGYGKMTGPRFNIKRVAVTVSRLVLARKLGRVPENPALHTCDVSCCIAENHLYEGTYKENYRDMVNRKRRKINKDERGKYVRA